MMSNFNNEDFERFLKQSADQLRMRPSNDVWEKIDQRMNRRRRRVIITSALFLLTFSFFGYYLVDSSNSLREQPLTTTEPIQKPFVRPRLSTPATSASKPNTITALTKNTNTGNNISKLIASNNIAGTIASDGITALLNNSSTPGKEASITPAFTPTPVDAYEPYASNTSTEATTESKTQVVKDKLLTIESVYNTYKPKSKYRKTEWQFFFTPTVSYRRLTENKSFLRAVPATSLTFNNAQRYSVNNMVTHKPAMGLEFGTSFKYSVARSIKLRTGLQFNISRYDIKAFNYIPEIATMALNSGSGVDSFYTVTRYRNMNSNVQSDWLENMYFQVSAPIGAEFKLFGNKTREFGIATTVQPTYVLGDRAYLISADYKNYSEVPSLTRRWNVNTAVEAFVGYSTGKLKWQIGPQVRYQLLSSFDTQYPVKENLFDFGLKVGVSLNK